MEQANLQETSFDIKELAAKNVVFFSGKALHLFLATFFLG
jgi:hypothetical protein